MAGDFSDECEPHALFAAWLEDAEKSELNDPNAMTLATVDASGLPDARMVLLKAADARGFVFYTNLESAKGRQLAAAPKAALVFHWKSLSRQVRVRGPVEAVTGAEADAYFQSRPRDSRIGAWASQQSRPLESRAALEQAVAKYAAKYPVGQAPQPFKELPQPFSDVPRPPYWSGFRVLPLQIEFWHDRPFRLHDRIVFRRAAPGEAWRKERLFP